MKRQEFKVYIESDLDRESFEKIALNNIREAYKENESKKKELNESQERQILNQMWQNIIETAYNKIKSKVKSDNIEAWKAAIKEFNLVEDINNSFHDY